MTDADFTVAIIGLGLVGGSLARGLAAHGVRVLGFDRDPESLAAALRSGAATAPLSPSLAGVATADVVVLAVPVTDAPALLTLAAAHARADALLTDVGSTKQGIAAAAAAAGVERQFVGGHPLAGDHRSGWAAARPELFAGRRVFLCPTGETAPACLDRALALWALVGAEPVVLSAPEHDRLLAWTSHLPQALAYALAATLAGAGIARDSLGPGGKDTLRLAASPVELWTGIALENAAPLAAAVGAARARLEQLETALSSRNLHAVRELFAAGHDWYFET